MPFQAQRTPITAEKQRTANLAKIHLAKKELAMEDDSYRALLMRVAGVSSAKDLSAIQADKVIAEMKLKGWKPKAATRAKNRPNVTPSRDALVRKIEAQLTEAGRGWEYLTSAKPGKQSMVQRLAGVERLEWAEPAGLSKIVAALAFDAKRNGWKVR